MKKKISIDELKKALPNTMKMSEARDKEISLNYIDGWNDAIHIILYKIMDLSLTENKYDDLGDKIMDVLAEYQVDKKLDLNHYKNWYSLAKSIEAAINE